METKYTKDGKKVAVLSRLNNTDWIVQELYVNDDGSEFPAGENFVVTTLLDAPAKTSQQHRIERQEKTIERLERHIKECEEQSKVLNRKSAAGKVMNRILDYYYECDPMELETLVEFMTGQITHVAVFGCSKISIQPLAEALTATDKWNGRGNFDGLKLVTLFGVRREGCRQGKSDWTYSLSWRLNQYLDGSGGDTEIVPFTSLDAAKEYVSKKIAAMEKVGDREVEAQKQFGLAAPSEQQIADLRARRRKEKEKTIQGLETSLVKARAELTELSEQSGIGE